MAVENKEKRDIYDLIIIGAGPAGLTASIYASRYKINHLVIGYALGGLAFDAHKICNFPTEVEISGAELTRRMQNHMEHLGGKLLLDEVRDIKRDDDGRFRIITQNNQEEFLTKTIVLAIGTKHRRLNLPEEEKFLGKGISYCATCDAMFYRDKVVAVYGGSDSANTASIYLSQVAKKVYQIYRRDKLRGDPSWIEQVLKNEKIEVIYNRRIVGLKGENKLEKIILDNEYQRKKEIEVDGLFIEIGTVPDDKLIKKLNLETDENGYIKVKNDQQTSQEGVWAAGDITNNSNNFRQIITACSEGAIAVNSIFDYLNKNK